jgi:hypothetical protein
VLGLGLESRPSTVWRFSDFQFLFIISKNSYKLQKCIENTILLEKILNEFFVSSLRAYLHIEINLTPYCSIKNCTKFYKIKP